MGQYQARVASTIKNEDQVTEEQVEIEREHSEGVSNRVPLPQETTPPLAPVFGSPIDSKLLLLYLV